MALNENRAWPNVHPESSTETAKVNQAFLDGKAEKKLLKAGTKLYRLYWKNAAKIAEELKDGGITILGQVLPLLKAVHMYAENERDRETFRDTQLLRDVLHEYDKLPQVWRDMVKDMVAKDREEQSG